MILLGIILYTLAGAAIWYFLCGVGEESKKGEEKSDCILCLILGFIGAIIMFAIAFASA